jgi:hypothetical protein
MDNGYYPYEVVNMTQQLNSHVRLYDASVVIGYRIAAKKRGDAGMTYAIKFAINCSYKTLRQLRETLLEWWPDYLKEQS